MGKVSNLVNGPILWKGPPQDWKNFEFTSEFRINSCGMDPPGSDIWWKFFKFYFCMYCPMMHANFAINVFPISWGPFENVNLLYFLLKMQIWNGSNALNIAGNPIKDINVNLLFLSSGSKVVEWPPPGSDIWWKFLKFYFSMYCPMIHVTMP